MAITQLDKSHWKDYFDRVSKVLRTKLVELDVESLKLGDQLEVAWAPLVGLTYDPKGDVFAVLIEGVVEHNIIHPKQIYVEQDVDTLHNIDVLDAEEEHHILILKDPLALPSP
jgi:hypothetical protein